MSVEDSLSKSYQETHAVGVSFGLVLPIGNPDGPKSDTQRENVIKLFDLVSAARAYSACYRRQTIWKASATSAKE